MKEKVLIKYENLKKKWKQQMPPIRENNIQFSGFKNPDTFQHCYLVKTKGANEQAAKTISLVYHHSPQPPPQ